MLLFDRPSVTDCGVAKDLIKTAPYSLAVFTAAALAAARAVGVEPHGLVDVALSELRERTGRQAPTVIT